MTKKKTDSSAKPKKEATDYDSAWKDVIEKLFQSFLEFFFPDIYKDIDFSRKPVFLSKELNSIKAYGKAGKRYADELVRVYLKNGEAACLCIFIHIEVQGSKSGKGLFEERTYIYNYRIFDKHLEKGTQVISLAVLTDEDVNYRPDEYIVQRWGFELRMKFPLVKMVDYRDNKGLREQLESSSNPMSIVVKSQLSAFELKRADVSRKFTVKWELIRQCYVRGYAKEEIRALLKFIDWLIRLPEDISRQIDEKVYKLEEDYKMPYVTSWERRAEKRGEERGVKLGEKRGVKIGEERGVKIGEERGVKKGKRETALELIRLGIDFDVISKSTGFPKKEIEKLAASLH